jgi:hypothetical protein
VVFHSGNPVVSWDGIDTTTAVVWDIALQAGRAVVVAYDAATLNEIYYSEQSPSRDRAGGFVKYGVPVVVSIAQDSGQVPSTLVPWIALFDAGALLHRTPGWLDVCFECTVRSCLFRHWEARHWLASMERFCCASYLLQWTGRVLEYLSVPRFTLVPCVILFFWGGGGLDKHY